jgi:protein-tyrosine-phosphatase
MTEGLLRERFRQVGAADEIVVASRGVFALDGRPASHTAVEVMSSRNIDISGHVAATITPQDIRQSDLILVMEEAHRRSIFHMAPEQIYKVLLLSELAGEHFDVPDPYTQPRSVYEQSLATITWCIDNGWETLRRRLGLGQSKLGLVAMR